MTTTTTPERTRLPAHIHLCIPIIALLASRALVSIPALANHRAVVVLNAILALIVAGLWIAARADVRLAGRIRYAVSIVVLVGLGVEAPLFHPHFVRVDSWYALLLVGGVVAIVVAVSILTRAPRFVFVFGVAGAVAASSSLGRAVIMPSRLFEWLITSLATVVPLLLIYLFSELYRAQEESLRTHERLAEVNARLAAASAEILDGKHRESLALIGSGIAHEINNPITYLRGSLELLQEQIQEMLGRFKVDARTRNETLDLMASMETGINSILDVVNHIRAIFKEPDAQPQRVRIYDALKTVIVSLPRDSVEGVRVRNESDASLEADVHPGDLYIIATNLIRNAIQATLDREDGLVTVRTFSTPDAVVLEVEDNGRGMTPEEVDACFDPFFTTRSDSGGMGVGLALSRTIAERAGGTITIRSTVGVGTVAQFHMRSTP